MRNRFVKSAALVVAALLLSGFRTAPIYDVKDAPVNAPRAMQAAQVKTAIIAAGAPLGWRIVDTGAGQLEGTLRLREHVAVISIPYSASRYSILYKSSENLKASEGSIHKNYNGWIQNLDRAIQGELSRQ